VADETGRLIATIRTEIAAVIALAANRPNVIAGPVPTLAGLHYGPPGSISMRNGGIFRAAGSPKASVHPR
jgi:hypothetical protein